MAGGFGCCLGGWVHHLHHGDLTDKGDQLVAELSHFGRELRQLKADAGEQALTGDLLPYALRFHLVGRDQVPLARFATAWDGAFADLPGWKAPDHKHPEYPDDQSWIRPTPDPTLGAAGWMI